MHFTEFFAIIERYQDILNPSSHEKLMLLAEYCGIQDGQRILDIGCGKGYLLRTWAQHWQIEGVGIDVNPTSIGVARQQAQEEGLAEQLHFIEDDAKNYVDDEPFDIVTCLGAPFAIGTFQEAAAWMVAKTKPDGVVVIGNGYLPAPVPAHIDEDISEYHTLTELEAIFSEESLFLTGIIAASQDDWDRYASGGLACGV